MNIYFKNGEVVEISLTEHESVLEEIKTAKRKSKPQEFRLAKEGLRVFKTSHIKLIGKECYNEKCSTEMKIGIKAHSVNQACEYDFTADCEVCGKRMWERNREYSVNSWGKVLCYKHSKLGHVPKGSDHAQRMLDSAVGSLPEDASPDRIDRLTAWVSRVAKKVCA